MRAIGLCLALLLAGCAANVDSVPEVSDLLPLDTADIIDRPLLDERVRAREIDVATDPNNPDHMAAVMMVPYPTQYALAPYDSMQWTGIAVSGDGGQTWDYQPIRGYPGDTELGPFPGAWAIGDGVVNFQPDGSLLVGVLPIRAPVIISIGVVEYPWGSWTPNFSSEFANGATGIDGGHDIPTSQVGPHVDKEQFTIDPFTGDIYAGYSERWQQSGEARAMFAKSSDGGRTWSDPVAIHPPQPHYIGAGQHQMGPWPVVTQQGEVKVIWSMMGGSEMFISDWDGGSFDAPRVIAKIDGMRFPSVDVDRTGGPHDGSIYAVTSANMHGDGDAFLVASRDHGKTWEEPVRINQDEVGNGISMRMPEVVVEPDGAVSVVYMAGVGANDNVHAFVARSTDGGRTFIEHQVSSEATDPASMNNQPSFLTHLGDYLGISYNRDGVVAVWQDGRGSTADMPFSEAWMTDLPTRRA